MNKCFCDRCGEEAELKDLIISVKNTETINLFCRKCSSLFDTCHFCEHFTQCGFESDPDPLPQFVMIQQRQQTPMGQSIIQYQVPNTERLRKFCLGGKCACCNEEDPKDPFCCRHAGTFTCNNFKEHIIESRNNIDR